MRLYCLLFLLITTTAWSQEVGNLLRKVNEAKAKNSPDINIQIDKLAHAYLASNQYDSARYWYHELLIITQRRGIDSLTAICMNDLGVTFYKLEEFDSCIIYYTKALEIFERLKDPQRQATIELNLSIIYKDKGRYEKALELALKAASKLEKTEPQPALGSAYNNIGLIYTKLANYPYALAFHRKALDIRRLVNYQKGVGQSYNNLALVFREMKQYDSALQHYTSSLIVKRLMNDNAAMASTLGNIGDVLLELNKPVEAESHYREALALKRANGDKLGEALTLNSMTRIELMRKNFAQAALHLLRAQEIELSLGFLEGLKETYDLQVSLNQANGNYQQAFLYAQKRDAVKDSLMSQEKARSLAEMQARYETEKKEQRIASLEQERGLQESRLETNRLWILILVVTSVLLSVIVGLVGYLYRTTQRNKHHVEMLLKELHHRVKNNLQVISSVLSLQSQQLKDVEAVQAVKASESRVNAMALIHRKLYAGEQDRLINMKDYTNELVTFLVHTYGFSDWEFDFKLNMENIMLDVDKAIPMGLILNELISNACKYAYQGNPHPALVVSMEIRNSKMLLVGIADNGKGITGDVMNNGKSSFGLKMVQMLMRDLQGKIKMETTAGTNYVLQIPLV